MPQYFVNLESVDNPIEYMNDRVTLNCRVESWSVVVWWSAFHNGLMFETDIYDIDQDGSVIHDLDINRLLPIACDTYINYLFDIAMLTKDDFHYERMSMIAEHVRDFKEFLDAGMPISMG